MIKYHLLEQQFSKTKIRNFVSIPANLVGDLISKVDLEWYDDEKHEPESDL